MLPVEAAHAVEFLRITLFAIRECHRLDELFFEQEFQRTVLVHGEHPFGVFGVVFDIPADMRILAEIDVETVVRAFRTEQTDIQPRTLQSVPATRFRAERQQILFVGHRQASLGRNAAPRCDELVPLRCPLALDDPRDLRTALLFIGELLAQQVECVGVRLQVLVRRNAEARPVRA